MALPPTDGSPYGAQDAPRHPWNGSRVTAPGAGLSKSKLGCFGCFGCLGCLGLVIIGLLVLLVASSMAASTSKSAPASTAPSWSQSTVAPSMAKRTVAPPPSGSPAPVATAAPTTLAPAPLPTPTAVEEDLGAVDAEQDTDTRLDLGVSSTPRSEGGSAPQRFVAPTPADVQDEPAQEEAPAEEPAPAAEEPAAEEPAPAPTETEEEPAGAVYYKNCDAVRAAGAAPIRRGDPGYAKHLDRDGDGQGCAGD